MQLGARLDDYIVLGSIGSGAMSQVFAGIAIEQRELVAIKILRTELDEDGCLSQRFRRESEIYERLDHPNIVSFFSSDLKAAKPYIVLEFIRGESLNEVIAGAGGTPLSVEQAVNVTLDVARALEYAHEQGVLHRDVKPANIVVTQDDRVKLLDFGIAAVADGRVLTEEGTILGTVAYSSPEQNKGIELDERSDLYSLGCIFYEMLTGRRALSGETLGQILQFQEMENPVAPSTYVKGLPAQLDQILLRMLAPASRNRFQSGGELVSELLDFKEKLRETASENSGFDEFAESWHIAKEAFARGDIDQAKTLTNLYNIQRPDDPRALFLLGKIYAGRGDIDRATQSFMQALELDGQNIDYRIDFALALLKIDLFDECVALLEVVVEREPRNILGKGLKFLCDSVVAGTAVFDASRKVEAHWNPLPPVGSSVSGVVKLPEKPEQSEGRALADPTAPPRKKPTSSQSSQPPVLKGAAGPPRRSEVSYDGSMPDLSQEKEQMDVGTALWARRLSSLFPGLGHLYCGKNAKALSNITATCMLLGATVFIWFLSPHGEHAAKVHPTFSALREYIAAIGARSGVVGLVDNEFGPVWTAMIQWFPVLLLAIHWINCRRTIYTSVLTELLDGNVIEVRDDGQVSIDRGASHGVEAGLIFTVHKAGSTRSISSLRLDEGGGKRVWHPIGLLRVLSVRMNDSRGAFKPFTGVMARPKTHDRITPRW